MWVAILLLPVGYLLGTFPSALLVARARGHDILHEGSGNPGASNVLRVLGWKAGGLVLGLDFAKGALAAGVGLVLAGRPGAYALGLAAVVGHMFPIVRRGGKGVAAAGGMLVVLFPIVVLPLAVVWFALARVVRKASVASLVVALAVPVAAAFAGYAAVEVAALAALTVVVVVRHAGNIRRLIRREERDLFDRGSGSSSGEAA